MRFMIATVCALVLVSERVVGIASATGADDQYLSLLSSHGVAGQSDQLIAAGYQACDANSQGRFGIGISPYQIAMIRLNSDLTSQGFSQHDIAQIILDASRVYCPEYAPPQ